MYNQRTTAYNKTKAAQNQTAADSIIFHPGFGRIHGKAAYTVGTDVVRVEI